MIQSEIIEDFLKKEDFEELINIKLKDVSHKEIKIYHNKVFKDGRIESGCIDKSILKRMHERYHPIAIKILEKFAPKKVNLYEYSDFHIVIAGRDYSFPIHTDTPNKLLSGVIYLYPEINKGTIIYSPDKKKNSEIKWKQNKAFFFSRTEKDSFHRYFSDGKSNRVTLIYNLISTNLEGVCKAENINYFYIKFREKINPYIYKYFKRFI